MSGYSINVYGEAHTIQQFVKDLDPGLRSIRATLGVSGTTLHFAIRQGEDYFGQLVTLLRKQRRFDWVNWGEWKEHHLPFDLNFTPCGLPIDNYQSTQILFVQLPAYIFQLLQSVLKSTPSEVTAGGQAEELFYYFLLKDARNDLEGNQHEHWDLLKFDMIHNFVQRQLRGQPRLGASLQHLARDVLTADGAERLNNFFLGKMDISIREEDMPAFRAQYLADVRTMYRWLLGLLGAPIPHDLKDRQASRSPARRNSSPRRNRSSGHRNTHTARSLAHNPFETADRRAQGSGF
ncbi:hypothetical protein JCM10207_000787 [Rhodosporidiobolus poonsookiae]